MSTLNQVIVKQARPKTSHDLARNMQLLAEWLLSRPEFAANSEYAAEAYTHFWFFDKDKFLDAVKSLGSGKKEFTENDIRFTVKAPGGEVVVTAPRNVVCRLIRPAEYECDPFLSLEEEKQLGEAS